MLFMFLISVWLFLMLRSMLYEYKYYQAVKSDEPEIWAKLGDPKPLKVPFVFISADGKKHLKTVTNSKVTRLAAKHKQASLQFLSFVVLVLATSIIYFKFV